jgi:hypothetical protein
MSLDDVKAGDFVALHNIGWASTLSKELVTRTTKTRIHINSGEFNRRGRRPGADTWSREFIESWDEARHPAEMAQLRAAQDLSRARSNLSGYDWRRADKALVDAVTALLPKEAA